ncbi:MAG: type II toxin-antitoxin system HicB family antitoxin [Saprospiraceae bacterium]|nr:type II toxin-antitoxin system HicB family antitoxin [Pyrinomonadaceae bacterium]
MLVYKASYKYLQDGIHGEVVDFPGVITCGRNIKETRTLLAGALEDMAETSIVMGEPLPLPNPEIRDLDADFDEPIHLILSAGTLVNVRPRALT